MVLLDDRALLRDTTEESWWGGLDAEVLECLSAGGPMAPGEIGHRLGISENAAMSVLTMLAQSGKVRVRLVEARR